MVAVFMILMIVACCMCSFVRTCMSLLEEKDEKPKELETKETDELLV